MSKIHVYDMTLMRSKEPRTGTIRCAYHVDMRASKDTDVSAPSSINLPNVGPVAGATLSFGANSAITADTHPDFPGGGSTNFTITRDAIPYLDNQQLPNALRDLFPPHGITLSATATVDVVTPLEEWNILDDPYQHSIVAPPSGELNVIGEVDQMEDVHIGTWDIAEVMANVKISEGDTIPDMRGKVDGLYGRIQIAANRAYREKYRFYGVTRNPV